VALFLLAAAPASAAPAATFDAATGVLTVTGDASAESFDVSSSGGDQLVASSADLGDPDGAGFDCAASAAGVSCKGAAVRTIVVDAGDGGDTLTGVYTLDPVALVRLNGEAGDDVLTSNNFFGQFRLDGGPGDDELNAGTGRFASSPFGTGTDTATGGPGDDTFNGSDAPDNFAAEPGADTYRGAGPAAGPDGFPLPGPRNTPIDTMTYDGRADSVSVTLDDQPGDGAAGEDDNVGDDVEAVSAGAGDDVLQAGLGGALLAGNRGNDVIVGGPGRDVLSGGDGDDAIEAQGGNVDQIDCGAGADSATLDLPTGQPPVADAQTGCELLGAGAGTFAKPVLTLKTARIAAATFRRTGAIRLTVRCAAACAIKGQAVLKTPSLRALLGRGVVGAGKLSIAAGARRLTLRIAARYRVKLANRLRTRVQRRRGIAFTARVTATDARGATTTRSATVTVKG
jgi:Ca2+-binding RTX toxin-like protein